MLLIRLAAKHEVISSAVPVPGRSIAGHGDSRHPLLSLPALYWTKVQYPPFRIFARRLSRARLSAEAAIVADQGCETSPRSSWGGNQEQTWVAKYLD